MKLKDERLKRQLTMWWHKCGLRGRRCEQRKEE